MTFVIDVQAATAIGQRAVVQHRHAFGRHALADAAAECTRPFAVEIALQPMAHRFVQQHARPAGAEHHRHFASRCRARLQIGQRGADGFVDIAGDHRIVEIRQAETAATAERTDLAPSVLLGNHRDRQANQRPHVGGQGAIEPGDQHHVVLAGQAGHDLHHARVLGAGQLLHLFQQRDFGRAVERTNGVVRQIQRARTSHAARGQLDLAAA